MTATVKDAFGNVTPGITVDFSVVPPTFRTPPSGTAVTDASGQATFCYSSALPGGDVISAFADTNGSTTQDLGEPGDTATKTWVLAGSTEGCKVTYGGRITAANGDKATFGGNAKATGPKGQEEFQDHGPAIGHQRPFDRCPGGPVLGRRPVGQHLRDGHDRRNGLGRLPHRCHRSGRARIVRHLSDPSEQRL